MIPATFIPVALQAVATADERTITTTAVQLGLSAPALVQACVHLLDDPQVVAANPRPCRAIRERLDRQREARDGRRLGVRCEV